MAKRKDVLNAALRALLAGAEVSAPLKIIVTLISELASLSKDDRKELADASEGQFEELLNQSELSTTNAALAAVGTEQIKVLIANMAELNKDQLDALTTISQKQYKEILNEIQKLANGSGTTIRGHAKVGSVGNGGTIVEGDQIIINNPPPAESDDNRTDEERVIHNIPYVSLGNLFKGRDDDFGKLIEQLGDVKSTTAITQAIHGLGGIGKTQLAVEYGWHGLNEGWYKAVFFVNCSQELGEKKDADDAEKKQERNSAFERLCVETGKLGAGHLLDIAGIDTMKPKPALEAVIKELHGREDWLVVFDNVDETAMADAVKEVLPQLNNGKVIITSRLRNFAGSIKPLSLEKFTPEASVEYLMQKTEGKRPGCDNDAEAVKELAEKLDGLPVAMEQAAAFINHRKISFEAYLDRFKVMEGKLLEFNAEESELGEDFKPVLTVWSLTEEQLGPVARAVNTLASFLAPDDIPESLFINQADDVLATACELDSNFETEQYKDQPQIEKADVVEDAIAQLGSFSMIGRDPVGGSFGIHRLVQEVIRLRLSEGHIEIFTQVILTMIANDCPDQETAIKTNYKWHKAMDSHISGLITFSEQLWPKAADIPDTIAGNLATQINNLALFYKSTNRLAEAEPMYKQALAINEVCYGKDHPDVASNLNNLAGLYSDTNRLAEAEPMMERALAIDEDHYGKDHPDVARDLNNLAELYIATNRLAEAEPMYKRVVEIFEKTYGENHPNVATALNNLAMLYQDTNRLAEAEPMYKRALAIGEARYGKDHPKVAIRLNNLAELYRDTNRLAEAEPMYKRSLAIDEASFGKDHPKVAIRLNNLALLYKATNRLAEAEPMYKRGMAIDEASYGKDHPNVAIRLNNLAGLYRDTNRLAEAEPMYKRAVEIFIEFTRRTGHEHPHLKAAINNYGGLLMEMGHSRDEVMDRLKRLAPKIFSEENHD